MKKDTTLILAILMIVIGAAGLLSINSQGFGRTSSGDGNGRGGMMGGMGGMMDGMGGMMGGRNAKTQFSTNGERIYYTATSESGKTITSTMGTMTTATPSMSCIDCHGMEGSFGAPDIRYKTLTTEVRGNGGKEHPPYTDGLIKRAITQGLNSAGEPLERPMPLWSMSDEDLEDLIEYLKIIDVSVKSDEDVDGQC